MVRIRLPPAGSQERTRLRDGTPILRTSTMSNGASSTLRRNNKSGNETMAMIIIGSTLVLVRGSVNVGLQRRIDEAVHRRRDAVVAAKFDHFAGKPWQLQPVASN